jgi:phosphonate transport system permease protein
MLPDQAGISAAAKFFAAAISPALDYEATYVPDTAGSFFLKVLHAMQRTVWFAAGGIGVALTIGIVFGFFCSSALWLDELPRGRASVSARMLRLVPPCAYFGARALMTLFRSIHELLWAVLFLSAFGVTDVSAILAIGIPSGGVLAKIFSELLDEAPRAPAKALQAAGTGNLAAFVVGLLPAAFPDMVAYGMYRFECALRSSAVLGFFGFPTLGYYLSASFENLYYHEVWTFLYAMFVLVVLSDLWSSAVRRRMVH